VFDLDSIEVVISETARRFYSTPGPLTDVSASAPLLVGVSGAPDELRSVVAHAMLHPGWAHAYSQKLSAKRSSEQQIRAASEMARLLWKHSPRPLCEPRSAAQRVVGTCRNFTAFYVALLRHLNIPARARCGHAKYFEKGKWVDHWVAEYWSEESTRWVRSDPQLDDLQCRMIGIDWSPADIPEDVFLSGGECWLRVRQGSIDPLVCGIFDMWGSWFVRSNVVRDFAALNKVELLPWDGWGLCEDWSQIDSDADNEVVDELANMCASEDVVSVQTMFADDRFAVPDVITSYIDGVPTPTRWRPAD
jgi:hypothetical protein